LAKAENVETYENPFRVKNDSARNILGIRSVTRRWRKGEGRRKELRRKSKKVQPSVCMRAEHPENDCSCETQKGSRGLVHRKDLNGIGPISISVRSTRMKVSWKSFEGASSFGILYSATYYNGSRFNRREQRLTMWQILLLYIL